MSTAINNGSAVPWGETGGWGESEWESPEYTPEAGWAPEAWPESEQEGWPEAGWAPEGEWTTEAWPESEQEIWPESEWTPEMWPEAEWTPEAWPESEVMQEADPFLPLLAAPLLAPLAAQAAKTLLPVAAKAAGDVMKGVLGGGGRRRAPRRRPAKPGSTGGRSAPSPSPGAPPAGGLAGLLAGLPSGAANAIRQLAGPLAAGATAAAQAEASFYGNNEFIGEVAGSDQAREAALTEVLAAEAAHTPDDREAGALLGAALPLTIRIMGGRAVRPLMPSLAKANFRLVQSMRDSGPSGPQLLRLVPKIHRNSVATLSAVSDRSGRPLPPQLVAPVVAAQAGKVMTTPKIAGPALARNSAIRQATVAPPSARTY